MAPKSPLVKLSRLLLGDSADPAVRFEQALASLRNADFSEAVEDFTYVIHHDPFSTASFLGRAAARYQLGDYEAALSDCTRATALDPQSPVPHYNRALVYVGLNDLDAALADIEVA